MGNVANHYYILLFVIQSDKHPFNINIIAFYMTVYVSCCPSS